MARRDYSQSFALDMSVYAGLKIAADGLQEELHLTLAFFGKIPESLVSEIANKMLVALEPSFSGTTVLLDGEDMFGPAKDLRVRLTPSRCCPQQINIAPRQQEGVWISGRRQFGHDSVAPLIKWCLPLLVPSHTCLEVERMSCVWFRVPLIKHPTSVPLEIPAERKDTRRLRSSAASFCRVYRAWVRRPPRPASFLQSF